MIRVGVFHMFSFKEGLNSMIIWESGSPELVMNAKFLNIKINKN